MRNVYCGICGAEHSSGKDIPFTIELTCTSCGTKTHIECDDEQITATVYHTDAKMKSGLRNEK